MKIAHARRKLSMSNRFPSRENFRKLMLARLQAVSSMNIYSLHGLDALIRAVFEQVCQRLMVVSYCTPGSPQYQVPAAISCSISLASYSGPDLLGSVTQCVRHFFPSMAACMNSSLSRTDRLAFWNMIELYASPLKFDSYSPLSINRRAFFSSFDLHWMNSMTSGCQSLMLCILAARRVLPP